MTSSSAKYFHSDNAEAYRTNASFVFNDENTREVMKLLDPKVGEKILDVGCGSGELTKKIFDLISDNGRIKEESQLIGTDISENMIKEAKKFESSDNNKGKSLQFHLCDGHELETFLKNNHFLGKFDKVFSNAALHWMKNDPAKIVKAMYSALKPGGTLAIEFGGHMNCIAVRSTLHTLLTAKGIDAKSVDPWYFPTPSSYSNLLEKVGFKVEIAYLFPRPTALPIGTGFKGWLKTFAGPFLNALKSEADREEVLQSLEDQLRIDMYDHEKDEWTMMYVRLRVKAIKP